MRGRHCNNNSVKQQNTAVSELMEEAEDNHVEGEKRSRFVVSWEFEDSIEKKEVNIDSVWVG